MRVLKSVKNNVLEQCLKYIQWGLQYVPWTVHGDEHIIDPYLAPDPRPATAGSTFPSKILNAGLYLYSSTFLKYVISTFTSIEHQNTPVPQSAPEPVSSGRWRVSPPALLSEAQSSQLSEEEVQPAVSTELKVRHKYGAKRVFKLMIKSGFFLDSLRGDCFVFLPLLPRGGRSGSGAGCARSIGAERSARPAGTVSEEERERGSVPERRRRERALLYFRRRGRWGNCAPLSWLIAWK